MRALRPCRAVRHRWVPGQAPPQTGLCSRWIPTVALQAGVLLTILASGVALAPRAPLSQPLRLPCASSGCLLRVQGPGNGRARLCHGDSGRLGHGRTRAAVQRGGFLRLSLSSASPPQKDPAEEPDSRASDGLSKPPPTPLLMLTVACQSACFGFVGTALPPALRDSGMEAAAVAVLLGQIGSASAFAEVMLSSSFGKLADAIGRKPILVAAPAITVLARSLVVLSPTIPVMLSVRLMTTLAVPIYWLALSASNADLYSRSSTHLAIIGSRIQAAMGLGFAISSILGAWFICALSSRVCVRARACVRACVRVFMCVHVFFLCVCVRL